MKKGVSLSAILLAALVLCQLILFVLGIVHFQITVLLYWAMLILFPWVLLYFVRRKKPFVFQRRVGRDPIEKGFELPFVLIIALASVLTVAVSAFDFYGDRACYLGRTVSLVGMPVFACGAVFLFQALLAYAPHHQAAYGEKPLEDAEQGAYASLRQPVPASASLMLLGVALIFSSWSGLIVWGIAFAALIAYAAQEDRWRFVHYSWYYDYTQMVPRKMIPFIW